jgi:polyisoprenoid-binding protein YceI
MSWTVDPMHAQVGPSAKHMGIMIVRGAFTGPSTVIDFNEVRAGRIEPVMHRR